MENLTHKASRLVLRLPFLSGHAPDHAVNQGPADIFPHGCSVAFGEAAIPPLLSVLAYDFGDDFFLRDMRHVLCSKRCEEEGFS